MAEPSFRVAGPATMHELQTELAKLDTKLAAEKAETGDVSLKTALAWWNVATTIRDLREMGKPSKPQQDHSQCRFSSDEAGNITAGSGKLSYHGEWEYPCNYCPRQFN